MTDLHLSRLQCFAEPGQISNHALICTFGAATGSETAYKVMLEAASVIYRLFSKQESIYNFTMLSSKQAMIMHALTLALLLTAVDSLKVS